MQIYENVFAINFIYVAFLHVIFINMLLGLENCTVNPEKYKWK